MDFEKEMQKSLKVIYHNIQALETKHKIPSNLNDSQNGVKRQQRKISSPAQGTTAKFEEQNDAGRERCFSF